MGGPTVQVHDWEPGIASSGLFWTTPLGNGMADFDLRTGAARLRGQSVKVTDYHDFFNAVLGGGPAPVAARVDYEVVWAGGGDHVHIRDTDFGFVSDNVTGPATITFTARNDHGDAVIAPTPRDSSTPAPKSSARALRRSEASGTGSSSADHGPPRFCGAARTLSTCSWLVHTTTHESRRGVVT